jgi:capsular polysaccharide biosynthesis protein
VDDADQAAVTGQDVRSGMPESPWADHKLADTEVGPAADAASGLASLSFITAAIRRRTRFWCLTAAVGLLLGAGLYLAHPPAYKATTEVLLTLGPTEDLVTGMQTDVALAQSSPVAAIALRKLGLRESVSEFLASYTATPVTNRVLLVTVSASSSGEAVRRANDLTTAFLQFRADQLRSYQQLVSDSLHQQVTQAKARVASVARRVMSVSGQATSSAQTAKLGGLQARLSRAKSTLTAVEQSARTDLLGTHVATDTAVKGSQVVNAAVPVVHSRVKTGVIYAVTGLIAGLVLGMGFVAIHALVSDRLRRRDEIAHALGASVRLSVGRVRLHRVLPGRRGLAATSMPDIQRIASHLRVVLPGDRRRAALAVVPADRTEVAALAVVAMALACAKQDKRVIVADLCQGAPAARLLGARDPGFHPVTVGRTHLAVVVPERGDIVPVGPLRSAAASARPKSASADLAAAYSSADVLLTLAALDPMLGAEHLATWAADVAVMVTAGRSSWTRVQAVGEMIRLAGTRLVSAVLVGADKTDESFGMTHIPRAGRDADGVDKDFYPPGESFFVTVNGGSGSAPPDDQ